MYLVTALGGDVCVTTTAVCVGLTMVSRVGVTLRETNVVFYVMATGITPSVLRVCSLYSH